MTIYIIYVTTILKYLLILVQYSTNTKIIHYNIIDIEKYFLH